MRIGVGVSLVTPSVKAGPGGPALTQRLVVFGDSITAGYEASSIANRWADRLAAHMNLPLINQGIPSTVVQNRNGGGGTPLTNNGRGRYVSALLGSNLSSNYVIMYGFNDMRYTAAPATMNLTNYITDLTAIIDGVIAAGVPPSSIVLASLPWIATIGYSSGSADFQGSNSTVHNQYNDAIYAIAFAKQTKFAAVYEYMRDNGAAALIDPDNIHPNNTGHSAIYNAMAVAAIPSSGVRPGTSPADTTAPVIVSLAVSDVNPSQIVLTYNDTLSATVTGNATLGGPANTIVSETVSGQTLLINVSVPYVFGNAPTVSYALGHVKDAAGNSVAALVNRAVTNTISPPNTSPSTDATFSATSANWAVVSPNRYSSNTGATTWNGIAQVTGAITLGQEAWIEMQYVDKTTSGGMSGGMMVFDEDSSGSAAYSTNRYLMQLTGPGVLRYGEDLASTLTDAGYTFPDVGVTYRTRLHITALGVVSIQRTLDDGLNWFVVFTYAKNANTLGVSQLYARYYAQQNLDIYQPRQFGVA